MKTTIFSLVLLGILLITVCSKCEKGAMDYSYEINLINNSNIPIGYYFATGGEHGTCYPDSLPETNEYIIYDIREVLRPGYESHISWGSFFESLPHDTLSIFIFSTDTLNKYSWEEIRDGYNILERYDLSQDDLKNMSWTITYP